MKIRFLIFAFAFSLSFSCFASINIVLVGPPGGGKGTLAKKLQDAYKIPHISSGDLVRMEIRNGTAFGKLVESMTVAGQLLPDSEEFIGALFGILKSRLQQNDCKHGFILDGTPRTGLQAAMLEEMLKSMGRQIDHVILLEASQKAIVDRLSGRLTCEGCGTTYHIRNNPPQVEGFCDNGNCGGPLTVRPDDREEVVLRRLATYESQLKPILDYFRYRRPVFRVDADQDPNTIAQKIYAYLSDPFPRNYLQARIPTFPHPQKPEIQMYNLVEIFKDVGLIQYVVRTFSQLVRDLNPDYIAAPEARSLPIFGAVISETQKPGIMIRKAGKIPPSAPKFSETYETAYSKETIEMSADQRLGGKTVVVIDDGISSGGTTLATVKLLEKAGLNVVRILAVIQYHYRPLCEEFLNRGLSDRTTTLLDLN